MRIGLISDTHLPQMIHTLDQLGPEVGAALRGVDLIMHGGDVSVPFVLDWCEQFAPVVVSRGNHDTFQDPRVEEIQRLDVEGWRIGMAHELRPESRPIPEILASALGGMDVDILIGGDTHVERLEFRHGTLLINSGSPILPHHLTPRLGSIGVLEITPGRVEAEIVSLGETAGARNPIHPRRLVLEGGRITEAAIRGQTLSAEQFLGLQAFHGSALQLPGA